MKEDHTSADERKQDEKLRSMYVNFMEEYKT